MKTLRSLTACAVLASAACTLTACESESAEQTPALPPAAVEPVSGVVGSHVVTATATVTAIDPATRRLSIRREDGATFTLRAGENVRNFPQIRVGDQVNVAYEESLAYEVRKPGEARPGAAIAAGAGRAKEGEKPAGIVGAAVQITATIVAIDRETMRVTLRGPDGSTTVVRAKDPDKVARVAVGDLVEITYTEALAVSVTTPETK